MDDYSRNNISSAMIFFLLVVVVACFVASVRSTQQIACIDNGNYTQNSTYDNNLNNVLSSITANMINVTGFYYASSGQGPDKANALVLCRADVSFDYCKNCTEKAISDIRSCCPNQKQAVNWREHCMLKYSDDILYARLQMGNRWYFHNTANTTSPARFKQDLKILLDDLRGKAATGGYHVKMAAGDFPGPDFQTIFAMVQCTPDLSHEDCNSCLTNAIRDIYPNCDKSIGCVVFFESCFLRYENYMFYNATRIKELETPSSFVHANTAPASSPPPPPGFAGSDNGDDNKARTIIIIIVIVSVAMAVLVILIVTGYIIFKERTKGQQWLNADEISTVESLRYDYFKIRDATNDFSDENKLGKGGFGVVYKGKLPTGQEIAVKRLSKNSGQGDLEFMNEVLLLARLQHRNLVKLLGFALEGSDKLLVYEFVQNASLDKFIFDPVKRSELDWDRRRKIIGGIARGILYLHEDSRLIIIHRDLKASNVLLDCKMNPKIADFGIARLFAQDDQTHGNTNRIVGTYGYMAPEYAIHGQFSVKSDVFSFGVLLLEIVSGRKNASFENEDDTIQDLLSFAWRNWRDGTCTNVIDPILRSSSDSIKEMLRCIHIGLLCVQDKVADRPKMASVVLMLSSLSMTLALPSEPTFFVQGSVAYESYAKKFDMNNASFSAKSAC